MRRKSLVEMPMKCQGKSDICQGKVREMSGNLSLECGNPVAIDPEKFYGNHYKQIKSTNPHLKFTSVTYICTTNF